MNSPDKQSRNSKTSPSNHKSKKAIKSNSKSPSKLTKSPKKFQTPPKEFHPVPKIKKVPNEINKFSYIYSPRTTFSLQKEDEERLFNDLAIGFDPITIKIIKTHFKERLGSLNKIEFIGILKNHLLSWHPNLPNRETILIKLLAKLFGEIDLNNNGNMEWDEFTNYIIHSSNKATMDNLIYKLKHYSHSRNMIDDSEYTDIISYAFYIEKFNLVGLVQESKSVIMFYDGSTCKKLKAVIDVKDTQREIDEIEIKELDSKAEDMVRREEEDKKLKRLKHVENCKKLMMDFTHSGTSKTHSRSPSNENKKNENKKAKSTLTNNARPETPEKLRKELQRIKFENFSSLKNAINKKLTILSTVFIPEFDILLISSSNNKISAWKYSNGEFKNVNNGTDNRIEKGNVSCAILTTDVPQYTLTWDPIQQSLYSGQADGKILKWKLTRNTHLENETMDYAKAKLRHDLETKRINSPKLNVKNKDTPSSSTLNNKSLLITTLNENKENNKANILKKELRKRDSVSCIVILGKLQLLAASYYNGNIILWDTMLKDYRKYYTDQETGIYQLIYEPNKNLLFSCGFDHNIFIYDPYIDGGAVYKLLGHNSSINSVAVNPLENELISIDINGIIKIWDLNNYYNYQTINLNESFSDKKVNNDIQNAKKKKISSNLKMIFLTKINKILTYGDKFFLFEKDTSQNPDLCDDQIILGCSYNNISYEIISICLKKIKIWNIFNGKVKKVYDDPMNNEITSYVLDESKKRIYLGDNTGKIKNFNMSNGNFLKDFTPHSKEICNLVYSDKNALLISLSVDQIIKFHEDKELMETALLKEINLTQMNCKTIASSEFYSRLILGCNGTVKFYDMEHFRFESEVENEKEKQFINDEIINITAMNNYEIVFISHESGRGKFMIIPPNGYKNFIFGFVKNTVKREEYTLSSQVYCVAFDLAHNSLLCGDVFGYVHSYDISPIIDAINQTQGEINRETLSLFDSINITQRFLIQANREPIKNVYVPLIKPNIFITTSNDRKVKLFFSGNGDYIDELKQISTKFKDVPVGIKFYFADPLQSKHNENEVIETGIAYRKDIEKFRPSMATRMKLKYQATQINEYSKLITEYNAKEHLYLITKNCDLDNFKSNKWNLMIDLDNVVEEEEKFYREIRDIVQNNSERLQKEEKLSQNVAIYSESYRPYFIDSMSEDKIKEFSVLISQKLRHAKLAMAKVKMNKGKYAAFEEENRRKKHINIKDSLEIVKDINISHNRKKLEPIKVSVSSDYGIQSSRIKNVTDQFIYYKEDFDKKLSDLEFTIEERLKRKMNKFILPKIKIKKKKKNADTEPNED